MLRLTGNKFSWKCSEMKYHEAIFISEMNSFSQHIQADRKDPGNCCGGKCQIRMNQAHYHPRELKQPRAEHKVLLWFGDCEQKTKNFAKHHSRLHVVLQSPAVE